MTDPWEVTRCKGLAARANFMGIDRPDVQFSAKEASRQMATPRKQDMDKLLRIGKYLFGDKARGHVTFKWGEETDMLNIYADSDWAGCRATRTSTSGGIVCWGSAPLPSNTGVAPSRR